MWWDTEWGCFCGMPEEAAALLRDVLRAMKTRADLSDNGAAHDHPDVEETRRRERELLPTDGIYYTYHYWLSNKGLTEHGGSVPGWLTAQGHEVLAALERYGADPDKWGE